MNQPKKKKIVVKQEESLFVQLFSKYIFYWPLFLVLTIVFGTAAFFYLRYTTPMYEANATMIIKDEKKGTENSKGVDELNMINSKKIIENEIEVLQSRSIMENVVKNLHLYAPISQEGKIRTISSYTTSPVTIIAENPDELIEVQNVGFKFEKSTGKIFINGIYSGKLNDWITSKYGKLKFVENKNYRPSNLQKPFEFSLVSVKEMSNRLLRSLQITSANKLSSIISISYKDEVPKRSEDVVNELISMYDQAAVNEKNSLAKNTLQFVNERLNIVSTDLDSIEQTVQKYKAGTGAQDISTQGQLYLQNVSNNDQELGKIKMQLAILDQVDQAVSNGNGGSLGINPASIGITDPGLTQLISDLNNKELEYERLKKTVAENNPMLVSIRDQINKIRPDIKNNLVTQRRNLEISQNNFMRTNSAYNSMLSTIPQKERDILEISRDQNVKNSIYSFLLQKKEESELSYASTLSDSRVINSAQASKYPVSPNKQLIFIAAILAALVLGILFITAKDFLSTKILYRKDLESMTAIPVLGEIAQNDSKESIVIEAGKRSFIAEEFRKIRASLHFLGINADNKKILITSSIPGEGKSFVSGNFAISNALTGKKVCLIDIDLHNPGLGKMFGKTTEDPGISDYLNGKKQPEDIIKKVPEFENLFFVSSGAIHESPSELLLNEKIKDFIDYLENKFDLIILDTAPSVLITDAYYLTNLCDATLYIVRHKHTPKMIIKRIDETMEINPLKNAAIIFNGVKKRGFFKNNYGYGYDYVYGGKYGPTDNKKKKSQKKESRS
jgi:capsular exopolysaccharide synthesis family protein